MVLSLTALAVSPSAQEEVYVPYKNFQFWNLADSLKIGASFTRTSNRPVMVRFRGNEAGWSGFLYLVLPRQNREVFLFENHTTNFNWIDLTPYDIQIGDTVIFKYVVQNSPDAASKLPKFTGPNNNPASPYYSQAASGPNHFAGGAVRNYGHRWSVAGRLKAPQDSIVIFGFEDDVSTGSDMDFDDVVFETTLSIGHPPIDGSLTFTDANGIPIPLSSVYEPSNPFLYLTYRDDYPRNAAVRIKTLNLTLTNPGTTPVDLELPALPVTSINGDAATWLYKIPLAESKSPVSGNQIAESYVKGMAVAQIDTHDDRDMVTGKLTATLQISYKDVPIQIGITPCQGVGIINRGTDCVVATVTNQPLSKFPDDSLIVKWSCSQSGDTLSTLARKTATANGSSTFQTPPVTKGEGVANPADGILTCSIEDEIVATVTDPVYGDTRTAKQAWTAQTPQTLTLALPSNPGAPITTTADGVDGNKVLVIATETSPTPNLADIVNAVVTVVGGESEVIRLTETGINTSTFTGTFDFRFVVGAATPGNTIVEIPLGNALATRDAVITVTYTFADKTQAVKTLTLGSLFNLVSRAWVKDESGNGAADHVYFEFSKPLSALPAAVTVFWNSAAAPGKPAPILTKMPSLGNQLMVADFSGNEFPFGLTDSLEGARATLPADNVFGAQQPGLSDSIGPVIVQARVRPFDPTKATSSQGKVGQDTLTVTLSEKLDNDIPPLKLIKNSVANKNGTCTLGDVAKIVTVDGRPVFSSDSLTLTFLVTQRGDATRPLPGSCVYLNRDGNYTDQKGNLPAKIGAKLEGPTIAPDVEVFRGYPPVVGINVNAGVGVVTDNPLIVQRLNQLDARFQTATGDPKSGEFSDYTTYENGRYVVKWIPPADWIEGGYTNPFRIQQGCIPLVGSTCGTVDVQTETLLPLGISTVQVVTTGAYVVDVSIYDHLGNHVRTFRQSFGYMGEFTNAARRAPRGFKSYLVWDLLDKKGQRVGQGAYIWKATFTFEDRSQKVQFTRTGVVRYQ